MQWPASELEFWSLSFSIDSGPIEKPEEKPKGPARELSLVESKEKMKEWFDG